MVIDVLFNDVLSIRCLFVLVWQHCKHINMSTPSRNAKKSVDLENSRAQRHEVQTTLRRDGVEKTLFARRGLTPYIVEEAYDYNFVFTDEHVIRNMVDKTKMQILKSHIDQYYAAILDAVADAAVMNKLQRALAELVALFTASSDAMVMMMTTGLIWTVVALLYCSGMSRDLLKGVMMVLSEYTCRNYSGGVAQLETESIVRVLISRFSLVDVEMTELALDILVNIMTESRNARALAINNGLLTHIGCFLTSTTVDPVIMHGSIKALTILMQADVPPELSIVKTCVRMFDATLLSTDPVLTYYGFIGLRNVLLIAHADYAACVYNVLGENVYARIFDFMGKRVRYHTTRDDEFAAALAYKALEFVNTLTRTSEHACDYMIKNGLVQRLSGMLRAENTTTLSISYRILTNLVVYSNKHDMRLFGVDFYDNVRTPRYEQYAVKRDRAVMLCSLVDGWNARNLEHLALNGGYQYLLEIVGGDPDLTHGALEAINKMAVTIGQYSTPDASARILAHMNECNMKDTLEDVAQNMAGDCANIANNILAHVWGDESDTMLTGVDRLTPLNGDTRLFADIARYMMDNN